MLPYFLQINKGNRDEIERPFLSAVDLSITKSFDKTLTRGPLLTLEIIVIPL